MFTMGRQEQPLRVRRRRQKKNSAKLIPGTALRTSIAYEKQNTSKATRQQRKFSEKYIERQMQLSRPFYVYVTDFCEYLQCGAGAVLHIKGQAWTFATKTQPTTTSRTKKGRIYNLFPRRKKKEGFSKKKQNGYKCAHLLGTSAQKGCTTNSALTIMSTGLQTNARFS